jgi:hypothetical protein
MEATAMALAHEMGLFTASMACDPDQAQEMAKSGADILIAYPLPWETPQETRPWEGEMGVALAALCEAARSVRSDLPDRLRLPCLLMCWYWQGLGCSVSGWSAVSWIGGSDEYSRRYQSLTPYHSPFMG